MAAVPLSAATARASAPRHLPRTTAWNEAEQGANTAETNDSGDRRALPVL